MAKKALIQDTRICQMVDVGDEFPVTTELQWVDVDDDTVVGEDTYEDGKVVKYVEPEVPWDRARRQNYPPIGDQLDDLYHKGAFSDEMAASIKAVKDKYPKPE